VRKRGVLCEERAKQAGLSVALKSWPKKDKGKNNRYRLPAATVKDGESTN